VGKGELLAKIATSQFEENYRPALGVSISKVNIELDDYDTLVTLVVWNISARSHFYSLHRLYFNGADGVILVFDTTRSSSFSNINKWYNSTVKYCPSRVPRILIGNKIDLQDERKIILPMAEHLSEKINAPYYEISALNGNNIGKIFRNLAEMIYNSKLNFLVE
ncbi:MAG: Rab family GTPase, partial [Candidatus Hermodarchaeota archaeon]